MLHRGLVTLYPTHPLELNIGLLLECDWSPYGLMEKREWSLGTIGKLKKIKSEMQWKILELTFFLLQVDTLWAQ
jgi:hypothetical protein